MPPVRQQEITGRWAEFQTVIEIEFASASEMVANQIYDITLSGVKSDELGRLIEPRFFYTAHEVHAK